MMNLKQTFEKFRENPVESLRVAIRRHRAKEIRDLLSKPEEISVEIFNREVWCIESKTVLNGKDIKGAALDDMSLPPTTLDELRKGLDSGTLELHGNYHWGTGSRIYGPAMKGGDDKKRTYIRTALHVLVDPALSPEEKTKQMLEVKGFGPNVTTGLVMLFHPKEYAIWNKPSRAAMSMLGRPANTLETFQSSVKELFKELGADDFIQLDAFLYRISTNSLSDGAKKGNNRPRDPNARHWTISLGEGGRLWTQSLKGGTVSIGWDYLGDLDEYESSQAIDEEMRAHRKDNKRHPNDALACFEFAKGMKPGDYVYAKIGMSTLLGIGVVESDYQFDEEASEHQHIRRVKWLASGNWSIPDYARVPLKTLTDVSAYDAFLDVAWQYIEEKPESPPKNPVQAYTIDDALKDLFIEKPVFQQMLNAMARKKNIILQGPPGVGKTFVARRLAYALMGVEDPSKVEMVQFHQSYSYEDFVQGYRPSAAGGFSLRNGVFYDFCKRAAADETSNYVFIVDEINRGNLSKIFGELLMLIEADKRGQKFKMPLTYSSGPSDRFCVPENVHLMGLMNTADRSLAMVDYALRRRFTFIDMVPCFHSAKYRTFLEANVEADVIETILSRTAKLNEIIRNDTVNLGPGYQIGHSYFCPQGTEEELGADWYESIIEAEIAPLLREYWFDAPSKAQEQIALLLHR